MTAVDRFWGLPEDTRVRVASGPALAWQRVELSDERLTPGGPASLLLPELRPVGGEPVIAGRMDGESVPLAGRLDDGSLELAFDPDAAVDALIQRTLFTSGRPLQARMPFHYHRVPAPVRRLIRDLMGRRAARGTERWPDWPHEPSVEVVRRIYLAARQALEPGVEPMPWWPDGKRWALCLSHDVDSAAGVGVSAEMAADERERGLSSCWYVLGEEYPERIDDLAPLVEGGGEIGLHDALHDNQIAFLEPAEIEARLDRCRPLIERFGMRGFRSPSMLRSERLYDALRSRFAYDSSVPDTGLLPRPNGCATIFPFEIRGVPVFPLTVPPDGQLMARKLTQGEVVATWIAKCEWIAAHGGAAFVLTHPEAGFTAEPWMRDAYRSFLDWARDQSDAWHALPAQLMDHWAERA